jgi:hypothetical protein
MTSGSEREEILEAAIAGIPQVAQTIADLPVEDSERAFAAAERSYQKTAESLGYEEPVAHHWVLAVMARLRQDVTKRR